MTMALTLQQRRIIRRVLRGWWLERWGLEGLGGCTGKPNDGKPTQFVSVKDMNRLILDRLIEWHETHAMYYLTDEGRSAAKG